MAPAQPNPVRLRWLGGVALALLLALATLAVVLDTDGKGVELAVPLKLLDAQALAPQPEDAVVYSDSFEIDRGPTTLQLVLDTDVSNGWIGVAAALIDEDGGEVREFGIEAAEWNGYDGERWSEGSPRETTYLGGVGAGRYALRFDTQWSRQDGRMGPPQPSATMHVRSGKRSALCFFGSGLLILLPLLLAVARWIAFEAQRWSQSDLAQHME